MNVLSLFLNFVDQFLYFGRLLISLTAFVGMNGRSCSGLTPHRKLFVVGFRSDLKCLAIFESTRFNMKSELSACPRCRVRGLLRCQGSPWAPVTVRDLPPAPQPPRLGSIAEVWPHHRCASRAPASCWGCSCPLCCHSSSPLRSPRLQQQGWCPGVHRWLRQGASWADAPGLVFSITRLPAPFPAGTAF